jgi:hypothetical protein
MNLFAKAGEQDRREQVHQVAGTPHDEQDAQPLLNATLTVRSCSQQFVRSALP